ncbi:hypothetical protein ACHAWO_005057 [Cyclotella atomus]|uniref:Uncharacterized protein n=1 Tax=Cyclotella atomus TaxID=382360 RepID=A0ABD3NB00_9STRA
MKCPTAAAVLLLAINGASAFAPSSLKSTREGTSLSFFGGAKKSTTASSTLATEAIAIYKARYPGTGEARNFFFTGWGMPESYSAPENKEMLFSVKDDKLRATFNAIAKLYGEDNALKMVKIQPGVLAFNKDNFAGSLSAFGEKFGLEEAKEMVIRNPGLLSVKPANAATADDLTMQLSYVVDVTRPIGIAGPVGILGLLSVPAIEGALGYSKGEMLASLLN